MSFWDAALEVGMVGAELGHKALGKFGAAVPGVGVAVNGFKALGHDLKSDQAKAEGDDEAAEHYGDRVGYDLLKAIPGVGTILGVGELAAGANNVMQNDGEFGDGMEGFQDTFCDLIELVTTGKTQFGRHTELRHQVEERERLEDYQQRHAEAH